MYIKTIIIALIAASVTAGSVEEEHKDEIEDIKKFNHGMDECCDLTGYPHEKIYKTIEDDKLSFCDEELSRAWITCFHMKLGIMDENHVINETYFWDSFSRNEKKLEIYKSCNNDAKSKDNDERACTLDGCIYKKNKLFDK